jgi:acyl-CoA thioester hydrolase
MTERKRPEPRDAYRWFLPIPTRWIDNDVFGHVNNVQYYSFFDTTVCSYLVETGQFHPTEGDLSAVVAESGCAYFSSVAWPDRLEGALRIDRLGTSSVRYGVAVFREGAPESSAGGHFTHVYLSRETGRPQPLSDALRKALEPLTAG